MPKAIEPEDSGLGRTCSRDPGEIRERLDDVFQAIEPERIARASSQVARHLERFTPPLKMAQLVSGNSDWSAD